MGANPPDENPCFRLGRIEDDEGEAHALRLRHRDDVDVALRDMAVADDVEDRRVDVAVERDREADPCEEAAVPRFR